MRLTFSTPSLENTVTPDLIALLNQRHGEPWTLNSKNIIASINEEWWGGLFREENHILHDAEDEQLYRWDSYLGIYQPVGKYSILRDLSRRILRASRECDLPDLADHRKFSRLLNVIRFIRAAADRNDPFITNRKILALANGVVEVNGSGFSFKEFDPRFLLRHKAAVPFEPGAKCPRFIEEFLKPMLDEDDIDLLIRQLGFVLLGRNPCHRMGILEGDSAAGKTTLVNLIIALIGQYACCQLRTQHLESQFELEAFRGRSLLIGADVGSNFLNTVGAQTLKGLVSSDIYHPETKNKNERKPLQGPFNVLIGTNCRLTYRDQGDAAAWRRRLILYHCHTPEGRKKIPDFAEQLLREEGPGIVNFLLSGLVRALAEVGQFGDLQMTQRQKDRVDQLIKRSASVEMFVAARVEAQEGEDVSSEELVEAYAEFCSVRYWVPLPERIFLEKVAQVFLEQFGRPKAKDIKRDGRANRGWRYLRLKQEEGYRPVEQ